MKVEEIRKLSRLRHEYLMAKIMENPSPYLKDEPIPKRSKEEVEEELKTVLLTDYGDIPLLYYGEEPDHSGYFPIILNKHLPLKRDVVWYRVFTFQEVLIFISNPLNVNLYLSLHEDKFSDKLEEWLKDSEALLQKIILSGGK